MGRLESVVREQDRESAQRLHQNFLEEMGKVLVHERQSMREHVEKKIGEVRTELKGGNVEQLARKTNVG